MRFLHPPPRFLASVCSAWLLTAVSVTSAQPRDAMIINSALESEFVRVLAMTGDDVEIGLSGGESRTMPLERCVAIVLVDGEAFRDKAQRDRGLLATEIDIDAEIGRLELADGQRYPGRPITDAEHKTDVLAWRHPLLGRLEFKLDEIRSLVMPGERQSSNDRTASVQPDLADVVVLKNGDELSGFIISIHDPLSIELLGDDGNGGGRVLELPLDRVSSVSMISPNQSTPGMRIWLSDGTVLAARSLALPNRGEAEVIGRWNGGSQTVSIPRESIAAVLTDAERIVPLSVIAPTRVVGPPTRYRIEAPAVIDDSPLLDVSRIEYRGPVTVHYRLPNGAVRLAADAVLPRESRAWGDFDLLIRVDGGIAHKQTMNAGHPSTSINIEVSGSELTIELHEGKSGPVQNHLILTNAMLLLDG